MHYHLNLHVGYICGLPVAGLGLCVPQRARSHYTLSLSFCQWRDLLNNRFAELDLLSFASWAHVPLFLLSYAWWIVGGSHGEEKKVPRGRVEMRGLLDLLSPFLVLGVSKPQVCKVRKLDSPWMDFKIVLVLIFHETKKRLWLYFMPKP